MTEKLPTIDLKGKQYVQVKDRVSYFNETYKDGSIVTEVVHSSTGMVTFKATITPDLAKASRFFTGHSFGTVDEVKAFEKLESVAVGRALAMMGIGIIDSIASAEETDRFNSKTSTKPTYIPNKQSAPVPPGTSNCKCGGTYSIKDGKFGQFLSCSNYPKCKIKAPQIPKAKLPQALSAEEIYQEYDPNYVGVNEDGIFQK